MALFGAALAGKQTPDPAALDQMAELKKRIAEMEARSRVRAKYGNVNDEQIAEYLELEDRAVRNKVIQEQGIKDRQKERDQLAKDIPAAALKAIKTGKLIVRLNGERVKNLPDLKKNCVSCGGYLPRIHEALYRAGEMVHSPPARMSDVMNACGYYGNSPGMWITGETCPVCKTETTIEMQYVFLE